MSYVAIFGPHLFRIVLAVLVAAVLLGACSAPAPYVYHAREFDRSDPDFGKQQTDADEVVVCYGKYGTQPSQVVAVATEECGRFGKVPRFDYQDILTCPLLTPVSAHYSCVAPAGAR